MDSLRRRRAGSRRHNNPISINLVAPLVFADDISPRTAQLFAIRLAAASAFLVRSAIMPASSSATEAICWSMNLPVGPSICGRSAKCTSTSASNNFERKATDRARRSTLLTTMAARCRWAAFNATASWGRSELPLSSLHRNRVYPKSCVTGRLRRALPGCHADLPAEITFGEMRVSGVSGIRVQIIGTGAPTLATPISVAEGMGGSLGGGFHRSSQLG
jgi:hypothetical protein